MEEGYFSIELGDLNLTLNQNYDKELKLKAIVEITNTFSIFKWTNGDNPKYLINDFVPVKQQNGSSDQPPSFLYGFNSLYLRSNFIELNPEVLNGLANATINLKVLLVNDTAAVPAGKPAKGAAPPPPSEETLFELTIPFAYIFSKAGGSGTMTMDGMFASYQVTSSDQASAVNPFAISLITSHDLVNPSFTNLAGTKLNIDNCLAEYILGCRFLYWQSASLLSPPASWSLHSPDVVDPKAKVPPTAQDLRNKYLENITRLIETQNKVATYSLTIGGDSGSDTAAYNGGNNNDDGDTGYTTSMRKFFPALELKNGRIFFDRTAAQSVNLEEDIRSQCSLWSVSWSSSSCLFLHRSQVRSLLAMLAQQDQQHVAAYIPLTMKKIPTAESLLNESGEVFATAVLDLSCLGSQLENPVYVIDQITLQGDQMDTADTVKPVCTVILQANKPVQTTPALQTLAASQTTSINPSTAMKKPVLVSSVPTNKDALQELRDEIANTLERIAQEYVSLYPTAIPGVGSPVGTSPGGGGSGEGSPSPAGGGNGGGEVARMTAKDRENLVEEQKTSFIRYLLTNGLFHDLQEKLRPKVQLLIKDRYGPRGRALGKSEVLREIDTASAGGGGAAGGAGGSSNGNAAAIARGDVPLENEVTIQSILIELYAFIMKECNIILNSLFTSTIIQKDLHDIENPARIIDDREDSRQIYDRLLREAQDAMYDSAYGRAEMIHLERLQFLDHVNDSAFKEEKSYYHDAYYVYAQYNLTRATQTIYMAANSAAGSNGAGTAARDTYGMLLRRAREALATAINFASTRWETLLLYASVLIESNQQELAAEFLQQVMSIQLKTNSSKTSKKFTLSNFETEFSGYESDALVPIHPRVYAILAALFTLQKKPLDARKALLLANRSYEEGGSDYGSSPISQHGKPRRTLVLILSETALYLLPYGLYSLANACVELAVDCEKAGTEKAEARGKPAITPPHIKYLLKRAQAENCWGLMVQNDDGTDAAVQAAMIASEDDITDYIAAKICEAKAWHRLKIYPERAIDAYTAAITCAIDRYDANPANSSKQLVPLDAFLTVGKLLISTCGGYLEASKLLLFGSQLYTSSAICLLLGVSYLRMERYEEAEVALLEANTLDNRNPDIWSYLCILCINTGTKGGIGTPSSTARIPEAEEALFQALRLQEGDVQILRELSMAFMSIDKLQTAEDLIRRAIAIEAAAAGSGGVSSMRTGYNRKLLADILASQNAAAKAIEEYQALLLDETIDRETKLTVAQQCSDLLVTLGRQEELAGINMIIQKLSGGGGDGGYEQ